MAPETKRPARKRHISSLLLSFTSPYSRGNNDNQLNASRFYHKPKGDWLQEMMLESGDVPSFVTIFHPIKSQFSTNRTDRTKD